MALTPQVGNSEGFVEAGNDFPETRFASLGEDRIAYQVFGEGDIDLLYTSATGDPIDLRWEWPAYATFLPSPRRPGAGDHVRPTGVGFFGQRVG